MLGEMGVFKDHFEVAWDEGSSEQGRVEHFEFMFGGT